MKDDSIRLAMNKLSVGELCVSPSGTYQPTLTVLRRASKAYGRGKGPGNSKRSLPGGKTIKEVLDMAAKIEKENS